MKLRFIIQIIMLLGLLLITDAAYLIKDSTLSHLHNYNKAIETSIESIPAYLIVNQSLAGQNVDEFSNLYFVDQVNLQNKPDLIDQLSAKYSLAEAQVLLADLNLPAVLEIKFGGERFSPTEAQIFTSTATQSAGVLKLIFNQNDYQEYWDQAVLSQNIFNIIDDYWLWCYLLLLLCSVIVAVYFRISYENKNLFYWEVFHRAGGNAHKFTLGRIVNSLLLPLIPVLIAFFISYFSHRYNLITSSPDYIFILIRAALLLLSSYASLLFIRNLKYV